MNRKFRKQAKRNSRRKTQKARIDRRRKESGNKAEHKVLKAAELFMEKNPLVASCFIAEKHDDYDRDGDDVIITFWNSMALMIQVTSFCGIDKEKHHRNIHGHIVIFEVSGLASPADILPTIEKIYEDRVANFHVADSRKDPVYRF